jgi:hypothetical protein
MQWACWSSSSGRRRWKNSAPEKGPARGPLVKRTYFAGGVFLGVDKDIRGIVADEKTSLDSRGGVQCGILSRNTFGGSWVR